MSVQPIDEADVLASVIRLRGDDLLMVTMYPGRPEQSVPTPAHIARQLVHGKMLSGIPFHREAALAEYAAFLRKNGSDAL